MMTPFVRRGLMAAAALMWTAVAASAQQARTTFDPRSVPELKAEFDRAAKNGLPEEPLVLKAREGYLKQASPKMMRDAVHALADRLATAHDALKPVQSTAELSAGADALLLDVSPHVLKLMRAAQKTRSLEVPLGVLTSLVIRGVPMQQATATVEQMLHHNVTDLAMSAVGTNVQSDLAAGVAPSVALDLRSKGVLSLPQFAAPVGVSASPRPPR